MNDDTVNMGGGRPEAPAADPLPAMIAAGRAASEGATEGPWAPDYADAIKVRDKRGSFLMMMHVHINGRRDGNEVASTARHIAAHPPAVTRALWDAVEALAAMLADVPQGSWDHMPATVDRASAALARLRAVAEAGR